MTCNKCPLMRFNRRRTPISARHSIVTLSREKKMVLTSSFQYPDDDWQMTYPVDVIFIGEAPIRVDETRGMPFSGQSGVMLDTMIAHAMELSGTEKFEFAATYFMACRPTNSFQGENRAATREELKACAGRLEAELKMFSAPYTIFLGETAGRLGAKMMKGAAERWLHPAYIIKKGGVTSAVYLQFVRNLSKIMDNIKQRTPVFVSGGADEPNAFEGGEY